MIVDQTVMERVIMGFREGDFYFEGFTTERVERLPNLLIWVVQKKYHEEGVTDKVAEGKLDDEIGARVYFSGTWLMQEGDSFTITYKLTWWWKGGGDNPVRLPYPTPGAVLYFEVIAA